MKPGTIGAAAPTDFGHDHQIIGIRMQRLLNDLISYMRTVEIAGIDVVHARRDSLAKNRDRTGNIAWRAPNPLVAILSGELHGPITDPVYSQRSAREGKAATETRLVLSFRFSPCSSVESSKRLSDQFLALLPERLGVVRIERIRPNAFTDCADNHIVRYDRADMAVLAVAAADFIGRGNKAGPD